MVTGDDLKLIGKDCRNLESAFLKATKLTKDSPTTIYTQRTCNVTEHVQLTYSRRRSPGGVITSQTTLCRNFGGKEGGGVLSKGAY